MKSTTRILAASVTACTSLGRAKTWVVLAVFVVIAWTTPAARAGLIINPTFDTASFDPAKITAIENAFNYAASEYESKFTDKIQINITVTAGTSGLGGSSTNLVSVGDYAAMKAALVADNAAHPSAAGTSSVLSLPATDPSNGGHFYVSTAEAKALGLIPGTSAGNDGTFTFNGNLSYTFDPNNRAVAGEFDFIGVAEHEISEIMGRIALLGRKLDGSPDYTADDLFRFTANGGRNVDPNATGVYLSADNGATKLAVFNGPGGGDLADYNGAVTTDPFNAFTGTGQAHSLNQADFTNLDIIGYDLATPEPATMTLLGIGVAGLAGYGWRRRKGIARAA